MRLSVVLPAGVKNNLAVVLVTASLSAVLPMAQAAQRGVGTLPSPVVAQVPAVPAFCIEDGTPIRLRTSNNVSSVDTQVGKKLSFEVVDDVVVQGMTVIAKGTAVAGNVIQVKRKRRIARGDRLTVGIDFVRVADGETVPVRGVKEATGGGRVRVMTGAIAASGAFFFPAAPFFLLLHGKDAAIPAGTELTAYVDGQTPLKRANFENRGQVDSAADTALLEISSNPAGADIEIDGKAAGNAPFSVRLTPGEHHVIVRKAGFSTWDKRISISPGESLVSVQLIAD